MSASRCFRLQVILVAAVGGGCGLLHNKHPPLTRLDPVRNGHQRVLQLPGLDIRSVITTASVEPPIFLIDDFLTPYECSHIIGLAKQQGLGVSQTGDDIDPALYPEEEFDAEGAWLEWNSNGDDWIDKEELIENMLTIANALFTSNDIDQMFDDLGLDMDRDSKISFKEFVNADPTAVYKFISKVREANPWYKVRYSSQTWLSQDAASNSVLQQLRDRLIALTHLPRVIVETSEHIQVVHYDIGGHYHCHLDTDPEDYDNRTCCHYTKRTDDGCRLCRYLTLLYYLSDVSEGGATAFPGAQMDADLNYDTIMESGLCNLSAQCETGIVVKPKMGSAVLWYSHFLEEEGQLGRVDNRTIHGGCDVIKGDKWIANNWIDIDGFMDYSQYENQLSHGITSRHSEL